MAKGKSTPHTRGCKSKMSTIGNEIRVKQTCIMPRKSIKLAVVGTKKKVNKKSKGERTTLHGVPIAKRDYVAAKSACKGKKGSEGAECVKGIKVHMKDLRKAEPHYLGGALGTEETAYVG
jgi:hypothetical protein